MITKEGSKTLFKIFHTAMQEKSSETIRQRDLAKLMNTHESSLSTWKKGDRLLTNIEEYYKLSEMTGQSVDYLYSVATEQVTVSFPKTLKQIRREMQV